MITTGFAPAHIDIESKAMETLASHGKTFYWASFFLSVKQARAAAKLYACCRALDDIADSTTHSNATKHQSLQDLKLKLENHDLPCDHALAQALRSLTTEHQLPKAAIISLIEGLIADTERVAIDNKRALDRYCYRVAGTVGLMMCGILGVTDRHALPFAIDLGIAMQLTNISRDVLEDAELGRRYIPLDVTPVEIRFASDPIRTRIQQTVADQLLRAEAFYESGLRGLAYLPRSSRIAIFVAAHLYRAIGRKLQNNGCAWWEGRTVISPTEKLRLILGLIPKLIYVVLQPSPKKDWQHASHLHASLEGLPYVDPPS